MLTTPKVPKEKIAKWGFGMAPISKTMRERYDRAVSTTITVLENDRQLKDIDLDALSELKGMFNRCVRQDQWDWNSVHTELGLPSAFHCRETAKWLTQMRIAAKTGDEVLHSESKSQLLSLNILLFLHAYQSTVGREGLNKAEWIYILSRREEKDILKIGRTSRPVNERVKEINASTGMLRPLSIRRVFPVRDSKIVETGVFERLADFRIRADREFFQIEFHKAVSEIVACVETLNQRWRYGGSLAWFDPVKYYGFVNIDGESIFVHGSEIPKQIHHLMMPGQAIEFDLGRRKQGLCAVNVSLSLEP